MCPIISVAGRRLPSAKPLTEGRWRALEYCVILRPANRVEVDGHVSVWRRPNINLIEPIKRVNYAKYIYEIKRRCVSLLK
jgi:hypothetical protein